MYGYDCPNQNTPYLQHYCMVMTVFGYMFPCPSSIPSHLNSFDTPRLRYDAFFYLSIHPCIHPSIHIASLSLSLCVYIHIIHILYYIHVSRLFNPLSPFYPLTANTSIHSLSHQAVDRLRNFWTPITTLLLQMCVCMCAGSTTGIQESADLQGPSAVTASWVSQGRQQAPASAGVCVRVVYVQCVCVSVCVGGWVCGCTQMSVYVCMCACVDECAPALHVCNFSISKSNSLRSGAFK